MMALAQQEYRILVYKVTSHHVHSGPSIMAAINSLRLASWRRLNYTYSSITSILRKLEAMSFCTSRVRAVLWFWLKMNLAKQDLYSGDIGG